MIMTEDSSNMHIRAVVSRGEKSYQSSIRVVPVAHDYGDGYYKYSCPICGHFGLRLQLTNGEERCPCCGVNLYWDKPQSNGV